MALFADGPTTPAQHRQLARQGDRSHRGDGEPSCARSAPASRKAPTSSRITPPAAWRAAQHRAPTTTTAWRCASRWPPSTRSPAAAVPVRILDPRCVGKTLPDYFETLFSVAPAPREAVPVLTIDGPTASGKGTLASEVAAALGYRLLDSGAVYRAAALAALRRRRRPGRRGGAGRAGRGARPALRRRPLPPRRPTTSPTRSAREEVGAMASRDLGLAGGPRAPLLELQLAFRDVPGLVADGRDMGSVVFPDAELKVFLTAGAAERAERRYKQLISKGIPAKLDSLRADLEARDARDKNRSASPLVPAEGAFMLDNSALSIEASVDAVLEAWQERRPFDRTSVLKVGPVAFPPRAAGHTEAPDRQPNPRRKSHGNPSHMSQAQVATSPRARFVRRDVRGFAQEGRDAHRRGHHRRGDPRRTQLRRRQRRPEVRSLRSHRRIQERPGRARSPARRFRLGRDRRRRERLRRHHPVARQGQAPRLLALARELARVRRVRHRHGERQGQGRPHRPRQRHPRLPARARCSTRVRSRT